jgi:phosphate transport system protein
MLNEKMIALKKRLVEYAGLVEGMVDKSVKGLIMKDPEMLRDILRKDEPLANDFEIELDETCTTLIAQYQPAAGTLRTILMTLRMNNDLERMGDHAVNIAESGLFLLERPQVKPLIDIPVIGETTIKMLKDGIDSFVNADAPLAKTVCERDSVVDDLKTKIFAELVAVMGRDPSPIERALHLIRITNNLERIADLSTNICEDVMFMVEGRVIKHHRGEADN